MQYTQSTLSFVYSRLVRHKVGADVQPGTFTAEPDRAERWEALDDTTYVFHLRKGVKWHHPDESTGLAMYRTGQLGGGTSGHPEI